MKRELVTGLLTLSLLASMLPANAQAAEGMFGASAAGQVQTMTEGAGEDGVQTENAADIDGTQYATLAEAVAQAEEGATIRLLRDVELDASGLVNGQGALTLSKDLTLDGSGHTIRAKAGTFSVSGDNGTGPSLLNLQDGAEVTLRDVTLDGRQCRQARPEHLPRRNGDPGERGDLQLPLVRPGGQWHGAVRGRPDHLRKPVGRQHRPGQPRHLCERCYCRGGFHCL